VVLFFGGQQILERRHAPAALVEVIQDVLIGRFLAAGKLAVLDSLQARADLLFRAVKVVANKTLSAAAVGDADRAKSRFPKLLKVKGTG